MFVSIRDALVTHAGYRTIVEGLQELNVTSVEMAVDRELRVASLISSGERFELGSAAGLERFKGHLAEQQVSVPALLLANDFNAPNLEAELNWVISAICAAHRLGIPAVRIDSAMSGERELSFEQRVARFVDCLKRVIVQTQDTNVALGIENHGYQGNDPKFLDAVLEGVGSPRLGLTLDTGNFYWYGHPLSRVYEIERHFAPVVKHTHLKNISYPPELREQQREIGYKYGEYVCPIPDGDVNHVRIVTFLREAGYDLDLCIEDESLGKFPVKQRPEVLRRDVEHVQRLVAGGEG